MMQRWFLELGLLHVVHQELVQLPFMRLCSDLTQKSLVIQVKVSQHLMFNIKLIAEVNMFYSLT